MDDNFILTTTLEYGQGYDEMLQGGGDEITTENYDYTSELGKGVVEYHLTKINYSLNAFQGIQTLRMEYTNRNDGTTKVLLDTTKSQKKEHEQEILFADDEEIIDIIFYITNDNRLTALSIKTNKNRVKAIGKESNGVAVKDEKIKTGNYVIFGFGVQAGKGDIPHQADDQPGAEAVRTGDAYAGHEERGRQERPRFQDGNGFQRRTHLHKV